MKYEQMKEIWQALLRESGLRPFPFDAETLDLCHLGRTYVSIVEPVGGQIAEPFHVTGKLSWRWDALQTARAGTNEDDMLDELFGQGGRSRRTEKPWMRVDIVLRASLPWGKPLTLPSSSVLAEWFEETVGRLDNVEPLVPADRVRLPKGKDRLPEILAWSGGPRVETSCAADGRLLLEAVEMAAWQAVELPRVWSDSDRRPDASPDAQLRELFGRVRAALHAWMEATDHLKAGAGSRGR